VRSCDSVYILLDPRCRFDWTLGWLIAAASTAGAASEDELPFLVGQDGNVYDRTDTIWYGGKVWSDWTEFINKENILKNIFLMY
jgi:hypothetical protein